MYSQAQSGQQKISAQEIEKKHLLFPVQTRWARVNALDVRATLPRCSAENTTVEALLAPASGRPVGKGVPAPSSTPLVFRPLSMNARLWANPALELPALPGGDVGAA